jgi:hypothetical protein
MPRIALRSHRALVAGLVASLTLSGCVDTFTGSNLQMDFSMATPLPGGTDPDGLQPPADTYFTFYALDHVYERDADGNILVDADGDPLIASSTFFEVQSFEIRPVIQVESPCFIELEDSKFPGLHVTQYAAKIKEATGIDDPFDPPNGASEGQISDVLNADRRMETLDELEGDLKALVSTSTFVYPTAEAGCDASGEQIPAADCIDEDSNAQRLAACRAFWANNPEYYEGNDKVFILPLNGEIYGFTGGTNPINQAPIGGATIFVNENLQGKEAFTINWQYKDFDGNGTPDYPTGFLDTHEESDTGYTFLSGLAARRVRGVINAHLTTPFSTSVFVDIAVFANLAEDDVQF